MVIASKKSMNFKFILPVFLVLLFLAGCTSQESSEVGNNDQGNTDIGDETENTDTGQEELTGCSHDNPSCDSNQDCVNNNCVLKSGCSFNNPVCGANYDCVENECILKTGCQYDNPTCYDNQECINGECVQGTGCEYYNPPCGNDFDCINNECTAKSGCEYNNPSCEEDEDCKYNTCKKKGCISDDDCNSLEICNLQTYSCSEVECKDNTDCPTGYRCTNNNCNHNEKICNYDAECETGEICVGQDCDVYVDCLSGSCEDKLFTIEDVTIYEDSEGEYYNVPQLIIKAKITYKGTFNIHNVQFGSGYTLKYSNNQGCGSAEGSYEYNAIIDHLDFVGLCNLKTFTEDQGMIEDVYIEGRTSRYLIKKYD